MNIGILARIPNDTWLSKSARWMVVVISVSLHIPDACNAEDPVGYDQVKEIFRKRCVTCHNPDELRGDLDLKSMAGIKAGSASGAVVVANDPSASLLYTTLAHLEDPVMPPNSPRLPAREQDLIRRWIEGGLLVSNADSSRSDSMQPTTLIEKPADQKTTERSKANDTTPSSATQPTDGGWAKVRSLPQASAIRALDAHPSRDLVAVGGLRQAVLIEPSTGRFLGALDTPAGTVTALRFSRDGRLLLVAVSQPAIQGTVLAFDLESGRIQWQVGDENDSILSMDLSNDGKTLAVGGPSRTVRLYDVASGSVVHSLKKHTDWILTLRFSPDGLLLASGDRFGAIFVWEPIKGSVFQSLKDHVGAVHSLVWDNSSETLLSGGNDGFLRIWDLHHGELTSRWDAQVGAILSVDKGQNLVVACGRKNKLSVWESPESSLCVMDLADQGEAVTLCSDRRSVVATDASGQISILDSKESRVPQQLSLPIDTEAIPQLIQLVEAQHANYIAESPDQKIVESSAATSSSKRKEPNSQPPATKTATSSQLAVDSRRLAPPSTSLEELLRSQIASGKQQLGQLTDALQASNQSLANVAKLNEDLINLVSQSSQIQAQLAQQIAEQSKLLQETQSRLKQLEQAVDSFQQ